MVACFFGLLDITCFGWTKVLDTLVHALLLSPEAIMASKFLEDQSTLVGLLTHLG